MTVFDRLLIQAVRWVPALMLAGVIAIGWAVFGGASSGWLLSIVLFLVAGAISREAARRAGHTRFLAGWSASKGWTAPEFDVQFLNSDSGRASLDELVEHAATYGYRRMDAGSAEPSDRFLRARLVRDEAPSP